jgi:hypothetical protein
MAAMGIWLELGGASPRRMHGPLKYSELVRRSRLLREFEGDSMHLAA